jgi:hypothetical protein
VNKPYLFFLKFVPSTLLLISIILTVYITINTEDPQLKSMLCALLCLMIIGFIIQRFLIDSLEKLADALLSVIILEKVTSSNEKED